MIDHHDVTTENTRKSNPHWPQIPDHPYRILIVGRCESGKMNTLLNLINHPPEIDKICFYAKDLYELKYESLTKSVKMLA